jgi:hypothetical protein
MNAETSITKAISNELVSTTLDMSIDYAELGFDELLDDRILKEIPIVKSLVAVAKIGINIKEKFFIKKVLTFMKEFHSGTISQKMLDDFRNKFNTDYKHREKVTEQIMVFLDAYLTNEKSKILAKLFKAHIEGFYDWEYFQSLSTCLNSLHPQSFNYLNKLSQSDFQIPMSPEKVGLSRDFDNEALLDASGISYKASPWASSYKVTRLGQDLFNYGIKQ